MIRLTSGDRVGVIALSNGLSEKQKMTLTQLHEVLSGMGLQVIYARSIYRQDTIYAASDQERAKMLIDFYQDDRIIAIFDVSGGDLANGVLPYLDYELIAKKSKPFFGYSDLTVILNALYTKTNQPSYLYQIRNLVGKHGDIQQRRFEETFFHESKTLFDFDYEWVQGNEMEGEVIGGNIRCFLKLAGTPYFPNFEGKILLLESLNGDVAKMATFFYQYKQMGVFDKINGLMLGSFTEMEQNNYLPDILTLVRAIVDDEQLPIIKTSEIGHGSDSKAMIIGEKVRLGVKS